MPKRFRDDLPPDPVLARVPAPHNEPVTADDPLEPDIPTGETEYFTTEPDSYGIFRSYPHSFPTFDPNNLMSLSHVSDSVHFPKTADQTGARPWWSGFGSSVASVKDDFFVPFLNATVFRLMCWFYSGSNMKSLAELDRLINEVILAEDFEKAHLSGFRATKEVDRLDNYQGDPADIRSSFLATDGWRETCVKIRLPADGIKHSSEAVAPEFDVPGLFYRPPLEVIKAAFREASAERFHLTPFKTFFQPSPNEPAERVHSEIYSSPAMLEAHEAIKANPPVPDCNLETVVAAVMLWSDSTHLTSFGSASLWPIYLFLGNQSKYTRGKPSSFAAHHLAYIPKVSLIISLLPSLPQSNLLYFLSSLIPFMTTIVGCLARLQQRRY
jgi:hypothetical protein